MVKVYVKDGRFATGDVFYTENEIFEISESDFERYKQLGHFKGVLGIVKEDKIEEKKEETPKEEKKDFHKDYQGPTGEEEFDWQKCKSKKELEEFALREFNVDLDRRNSLKKMKEKIKELIEND